MELGEVTFQSLLGIKGLINWLLVKKQAEHVAKTELKIETEFKLNYVENC